MGTTKQEQVQRLPPISVRFPPHIKREIEKLVEEGYFKSMSSLILNATYRLVEQYHPSQAVRDTRAIRREMWEEYMRKANGDENKAWGLFCKDLKKQEEEDLKFLKSVNVRNSK